MKIKLLIFFVPCFAVLGLNEKAQSQIAKSPTQTVSPNEWSAPAFVEPRGAIPQHVQLLERRKSEFESTLDSYNVNLKYGFWSYTELQSPFLAKHAIFRFESIERSEGSSVFVAVFPLTSAPVRIIPLWYRGLGFPSQIERDPHNIAVFNSVVAEERPVLDTDADRISLALLYLCLFDKDPKIASANKDSSRLMPSVKNDPQGGFAVGLSVRKNDNGIGEFSLDFDKMGMLRDITSRVRPPGDR